MRLVVACVCVGVAASHATAQMEVTFTGNNGATLSAGGIKVLIDSLQDHLNTCWTRLPQADLLKMTAGQAPFDNVAYALATHNHPDHYGRTPVLNFLTNNPQATFVAPPQNTEFTEIARESYHLATFFRVLGDFCGSVFG